MEFHAITLCSSAVGVGKVDGWIVLDPDFAGPVWKEIKETKELRVLARKRLCECTACFSLKMDDSRMRDVDRLREENKQTNNQTKS